MSKRPLGLHQRMGDVIVEAVQRGVSLLPLRRHQFDREPGISAMVRIAGVEPWTDLSLLSIRDLADEVIVVDSSNDRQVLSRIKTATDQGVVVNHIRKDVDIYEASWIALEAGRYEWFLQWDADFIAHTDGNRSARGLRERILSLPKRYFIVSWPLVCLDIDLFHQLPGYIHREEWLFTYHPSARYTRRGPWEYRVVPLFFKPLRWKEVYGFHLRTVKPPVSLLRRAYRPSWMRTSREISLESYIRGKIQEDYGTSDVNLAGESLVEVFRQHLAPYRGEHPELLKPFVEGSEEMRA